MRCTPHACPGRGFAHPPPSAWSTAATAKRMVGTRISKEKEAADRRRGKGGTKDKKGKDKKDALSFQQREKRKRDMGQSSRGKSFVEGPPLLCLAPATCSLTSICDHRGEANLAATRVNTSHTTHHTQTNTLCALP